MQIFIIIIVLLFCLIVYLIGQLYTRFKHDTINTAVVTKKLEEIAAMDSKNARVAKNNISILFKQGNATAKIEVELFDQELPITCKNFRSIAFNGLKQKTFTHTKVYEILKGKYGSFGDITNNDGTGETSLYGRNFIDESFRYTHAHAGTISMVNRGPNTNSSKFLITTAPCPELDGINVVFGKVVKGLYELLNILDCDIDNNKPNVDIEIMEVTMV
tara:strand:- start:121 stop:771 length:651 start_codon:yes stop_codon:yes gene_type:complete